MDHMINDNSGGDGEEEETAKIHFFGLKTGIKETACKYAGCFSIYSKWGLIPEEKLHFCSPHIMPPKLVQLVTRHTR